MTPTLVILAAGMGSRYGGLKQVDTVGPSGETIMDYSIYDALKSGFGKIVFIIRKSIEQDFRTTFTNKLEGKVDFSFVYQELDNLPGGIKPPVERMKPWGTGHAVMVAAHAVKEAFAVINADDFYGYEAYEKMAGFLKEDKDDFSYSMVGYKLDNTLSEFGYVSRGICKTDSHDKLLGVIERTKIRKEKGQIVFQDEKGNLNGLPADSPVSMNFWGFKPVFFAQLQELFSVFMQSTSDKLTTEFYLSSAIDDLIKSNKIQVNVLRSNAKWFGITYKEDKPDVTLRILSLVENGNYPISLW